MSDSAARVEGKRHEAPPDGRSMTIEEAMAIAIERLRDEQPRDAEMVLRRILEAAPDYPDALHYLGMLTYKDGRRDEAIALMERSLELAPGQADWHSNLGIVLQAGDELERAMQCFERAIELQPAHANAHNNLGVLLRVFSRTDEAEAAYRRAIAIEPSHGDAYHNLALVLDLTGRTREAIAAYSRALTLKPAYPEVRRVLALAYCSVDERDKAISLCEAWLADEPDDPVARHTLAAVSGRNVPPRAGDAYVQRAFDSFSTTFEAKLALLEYRAPQLVARSLGAAGLPSDGGLDVLDAGCGTGLCAPLLAPYARRMVGVDLSAGMLRHAEGKRLYDDLTQGELTEYLQQHPGGFDVIVSADTLVYFGALEDVAAAAARALRPGGVLVFTVEEWEERAAVQSAQDPVGAAGEGGGTDDGGPGGIADHAPGYCLRPHGRYSHRPDYVERVLRRAGLQVHIDRDELRKEQGMPVAGLIVRASRPAGAGSEGASAGARIVGEPHA